MKNAQRVEPAGQARNSRYEVVRLCFPDCPRVLIRAFGNDGKRKRELRWYRGARVFNAHRPQSFLAVVFLFWIIEWLNFCIVMTKKIKNQKLSIYQAKNGAIQLRPDAKAETLWATQKQISEIFGVDVRTVSEHLKNIYKDAELTEKSTIRKFRIVKKEGKREVMREINFYNLDAIISVGYRVNSKRATEFRIWATKTLKQHITQGYTINPKIIQKNYQSFLDAVEDIQKLLPDSNTVPAENVLDLIKVFANTWLSLESYDEDKLPQKGFSKKDLKISADDLYGAVGEFKKELVAKKQASELFAQEKQERALEGILGNVMQSAFGRRMYGTVEEKASHLLYFIVKNHPFSDGNKRTGAFSFVWFLQKSGISFRDKITPQALTAITLLIAESNPKDKDRIIGLVLLMLKR